LKHSFIIPAYGESKHLEECIKSLLSQSVKSEIAITTSTPNTYIQDTAQKYGIDVIVNRGNPSISSDWNFALRNASTKYVTLAHQDDFYAADYVECNLKIAEKKDDMLIQFSDYSEKIHNEVKSDSIKVRIKKLLMLLFIIRKTGFKSKLIKKSILSLGCPICCPTVFFNKEKLGEFTFNNDYRINLDWDAWIRTAEMDGRFIYINKKLLIHRIHEESETSKNLGQRKTEDREMFDELWYYPLSRVLFFLYSLSYTSFK
jgi:glycosyltransferase involved in cell wall biosynthesis